MKKKIFNLFIIALVVVCLSGCDDGTFIGGNNSNNDDNTSTAVSRTPSLYEIQQVFVDWDTTYYVNSLKEAVNSLSTVELVDAVNFIKQIKSTYNMDNIFNEGTNTISNTAQVGLISSYSTTSDEHGPILIIKNATINESNGSKRTVNLVLIGGTELKSGQATGILSDLYSGMGLTNEYLYDAYYAIYNNLKGTESTPLVIGGISLGGMVAQQLAGLPAIKEYFKVINVVAIASPIVSPDKIDYSVTTVNRIVDTVDLVPKVSVDYDGTYTSKYGSSNAAVVKTGTYKTFLGAHALGYVNKSLWSDVDALGFLSGSRTITYEKSNMTWYDAPVYKAAK